MRGVIFVALLAVVGAGEARAQDGAAGEKVFGVCKTTSRKPMTCLPFSSTSMPMGKRSSASDQRRAA